MKLSGRQDIEAPIAFVHRMLSDFDGWERSALRRGAEVSRTDALAVPGPGMEWLVRFDFRAKRRTATLRLEAVDPPTRLRLSGFGANLEGEAAFDLLELGARRTRVHVALEARPRTLAARLFLQSMRLAKARVQRRFDQRLASVAADIEDRHRSSPT